MMPLTVAVVTAHASQCLAQGAFPAPLPSQAAPSSASPFPPVNGAAPSASLGGPSPFPATGAAPLSSSGLGQPPAAPTQAGPGDDCMKGFMALRVEAEKRGKMIKA